MPRPHRLLLLFAMTAAACTGFRPVRDDVYRSPQLHEHLMAQLVEDHGIRTIVCLRGSGQSSWPSRRAALGTEAEFWLVPMSATSPPSGRTLLALWQVASTAQRPLLMHCRAGVDRTGLASALVVLHDTGDLAAARQQLDLIPYGHVAWSATGAMDAVLDAYEPHAATLSFPDWVRQVYAPGRGEPGC